MHNFIAIAGAIAIGAVASLTITKNAHTPDANRSEILMPSILHMMSDARTLAPTPIVAP